MGFSKKWCLGLLPAVIASFAVMTSFLATFWCETIKFPPTNEGDSSLQFGPWYQKETVQQSTSVGGETYIFTQNVCVNFPSNTYKDPKLKTVRAFSIMVLILGGLATVGLWFAPCCYGHTQSSWRHLAMLFSVILTLFQGLTFLIFNSSFCTNNSIIAMNGWADAYVDQCQWDQGSTCNVVSTVLFFVTGIVMCFMGPPQRSPPEPTETQAVTYQKTTNPDGTTTVAQVAVVKGTAVPAASTPNVTGETNNNKMEEPLETA